MVASKYVTGIGMIVIAVAAFAVGLFASPMIFPVSGVDTVWENIVKTGKITIGTDPTWEPYEFLNTTTGKIVGFEVELMDTIASKLGFTTEWQSTMFDSIILSVQSKTLDLGVSGFSVTQKRLEVVDFTAPHSKAVGEVIMLQSRRDDLGITTLKSLSNLTDYNLPNGLKVGTQSGTTEEEELMAAIPSHKHGSLILSYDSYDKAFLALKDGSVDCVYAETPITTNWIAKLQATYSKPTVVVYSVPYYYVAFMANKEARFLVSQINAVLFELISTGQLDALKLKWHA